MSADIYNARIVAEAKEASHAGRLPHPSVEVVCDNPLCGDRVTLGLEVQDGKVGTARHHTRGCLLTRAAAALLARHLEGRSTAEAPALRAGVEAVLAGGPAPADWPELEIFAPVAAVRSRHDCVTLPIKALERAIGELEKSRA